MWQPVVAGCCLQPGDALLKHKLRSRKSHTVPEVGMYEIGGLTVANATRVAAREVASLVVISPFA